MRIAIPMDEKTLESNVCPSFGRSPYFLIYNTETDESNFIENSAAASQGGAGIKAAQLLVDNAVDTVLTARCGENAAEVLIRSEIHMFKATSGSAKQNIEAHKAEQLPPLNEFHAGFHGHAN